MAFAPLRFVGIGRSGGRGRLSPGRRGHLQGGCRGHPTAARTESAREIAATSHAADLAAQEAVGPITIAPPPRGQGQVVFFRPKSVLGTGQWFNVREADKPLGKLTNGAYFASECAAGDP